MFERRMYVCVRVKIYVLERRMYVHKRRMYVCVRVKIHVCERRMYVCENENICMCKENVGVQE